MTYRGWNCNTVDIDYLKGRTVATYKRTEDELRLDFTDGTSIVFSHMQDCCENVWLEDVSGDLDDLLNSEILLAEERTNDVGYDEDKWESKTWTFYTIRTHKGTVDLRFFGMSNGYYSEEVDIILLGDNE